MKTFHFKVISLNYIKVRVYFERTNGRPLSPLDFVVFVNPTVNNPFTPPVGSSLPYELGLWTEDHVNSLR